ncbi:hypothetical protein GBAR_LOCUS22838, partial [Geodia barretti]
TVSRRGPRPIGPSGGTTPGALSPGGRTAGGRRAGHPGLHGLPSGPLAEAVVQQPAGTAEPGDKAPEPAPERGRGGHLPQPAIGAAPGGRGAGRATRRMGRSPPLPHHPQRRRQRGTAGAQHAGRSGLINIKRDDALLHYLYVAVVPWIGRSAGRARGARRSLLGEPGHNPGLHRRQVGHPSRRSGRSERIQ